MKKIIVIGIVIISIIGITLIFNNDKLNNLDNTNTLFNEKHGTEEFNTINTTLNIRTNIEVGPTKNTTLDKVSMVIKEGTLTKTSATIIITDTNENAYSYGRSFIIEKKENNNWKELDTIGYDYAFTTEVLSPGVDGKLELKTDWLDMYGELEKGEYRIVKDIATTESVISVEFNIY